MESSLNIKENHARQIDGERKTANEEKTKVFENIRFLIDNLKTIKKLT